MSGDGKRSEAAVRSVVKVLRQKLATAGMHDLADAIDGTTARHYGLMLRAIFGDFPLDSHSFRPRFHTARCHNTKRADVAAQKRSSKSRSFC